MSMSSGVDAIRASIKGVTRALSDRDIRVTQVGAKAFVESVDGIPKRVNIPNIPGDASPQLITAVNGFLDHEVAHLLYTDFKVSSSAGMSEAQFGIYNALEDTRIEKEMCKRFVGSGKNLESVANFLIEKSIAPQYETCDQAEKLSLLFMPSIRAWSGQEVFSDFMDDKWDDMKDIESKIKHLTPRIKTLSSTKDAVDLAIEMYAALKNEEDQEDEGDGDGNNSDNSDSSGEGDSEGGSDDGKESGDDDSEDDSDGGGSDESDPGDEGDSDDDSDEDDSDEDGSSKGSSDGDEESDDDGSDEESDDDGSDEESDDDGSDSDSSGSSGGGSDEDLHDDKASGIEHDDDGSPPEYDVAAAIADAIENIKDFDDEVSDEISKMSLRAIVDSDYIVYTKDNDVVEEFKVDSGYRPEHLERLEDSTRKIAGPLQKTLERLVMAKSHCRNLPGKTSGRVNPSSLYRLKTGDRRVFRQKEINDSKDVAVSLAIDCSGSMYSNSKIKTAMQCAFALSSVLSRLNVSNEVIGFTTRCDWDAIERAEEEGASLGIKYSRFEPLYMPIFKSFDERLGTQQKKRMAYGAVETGYLKNNIDGECIEIAARRLLARPEAGKKMFVLSDGSPAGHGRSNDIRNHLKKVVVDVRKSGVDILGIGINDSSVKNFYNKCVVIDNVHSLPKILMSELKALLV